MDTIATAVRTATDMQTLISSLGETPGARAYESAFRTLEELQGAADAIRSLAALGDVTIPDSGGHFECGLSETPYTMGKVFFTAFRQGQRGPWADLVATSWRLAKLVPERATRFEPKEYVRYRVRLTRQIGQGRTPVWLCVPLEVREDEARDEAQRLVTRAKYKFLGEGERIDRRAQQILQAFVDTLTLPRIAIPEGDVLPRDFGRVEWGKWDSAPTTTNTTPHWTSGMMTPPPRQSYQMFGRRTATWSGQCGTYEVTMCRSQWRCEYTSPDGGRRHDEGWQEQAVGEPVLVDGVDVIAAREAAVAEDQADLPARRSAAWDANRAARARAVEATQVALDALQIPALPVGARLDVDKIARELIYKRITAA